MQLKHALDRSAYQMQGFTYFLHRPFLTSPSTVPCSFRKRFMSLGFEPGVAPIKVQL